MFYPPQLAHEEWLSYYARYFSSVEVDSTFYHMPGEKAVAHWLEQTPGDFVFNCKMPREITHEMRLRNCEDKVKIFLDGIEPLRPKLGCILIQLPPVFTPKPDEKALRFFLAGLPPSFRFAVEFCHADWHLPRVVHHLEDHGICWAWNDTTALHEQNSGAFEPLPQTAKFLYVRLLGDFRTKHRADGSRLHRYGSLMWPRDSSIENWAIKIQKHMADSERVFLHASNHFEGFAPLTCQRIGHLLNIPVELPGIEDAPVKSPARQMNLL